MLRPSSPAPEDFSAYMYTAQILREDFHKDETYIRRFLQIAKATEITLDALFLGQKDSKTFTANQAGYSEVQKQQYRAMLQCLIAQQFPKEEQIVQQDSGDKPKPTYNVIPGSPGAGKTYMLQQTFNIDVANNKFVDNAIVIGPDLIVMVQMHAFKEACALPIGEDRTKAMIAAYSKDRDFSNAATNFMLIKAMTDGLNIVHDSNFSSTTAHKILDTLGKIGYQRNGAILMADKASRVAALELRRDLMGGFALVTPEDAASKGVALYERIADRTYIGRFDNLSLYIQEPEFYLDKGRTVHVAEYNKETANMDILPGGQGHIDRIMSQAATNEGLSATLLASLQQEVSKWKKAPELSAQAAAAKFMPTT